MGRDSEEEHHIPVSASTDSIISADLVDQSDTTALAREPASPHPPASRRIPSLSQTRLLMYFQAEQEGGDPKNIWGHSNLGARVEEPRCDAIEPIADCGSFFVNVDVAFGCGPVTLFHETTTLLARYLFDH